MHLGDGNMFIFPRVFKYLFLDALCIRRQNTIQTITERLVGVQGEEKVV